ncbi:cupin domain-containing protein [Mariniphaga sp.]|uniref:cupin domain-containing protein n=1 Tax=Mariniphaga sp. TaxID=1954475 RepID=UPI003567229C
MKNIEFEKSIILVLVDIIEYVPNSVVSKTIIRKTTGNIILVAIDRGEALTENTSPYDIFIQIIEGTAEVVIEDNSNTLQTGQGIVVPAHSTHMIKANERFKMISTIIKSGYEGILI